MRRVYRPLPLRTPTSRSAHRQMQVPCRYPRLRPHPRPGGSQPPHQRFVRLVFFFFPPRTAKTVPSRNLVFLCELPHHHFRLLPQPGPGARDRRTATTFNRLQPTHPTAYIPAAPPERRSTTKRLGSREQGDRRGRPSSLGLALNRDSRFLAHRRRARSAVAAPCRLLPIVRPSAGGRGPPPLYSSLLLAGHPRERAPSLRLFGKRIARKTEAKTDIGRRSLRRDGEGGDADGWATMCKLVAPTRTPNCRDQPARSRSSYTRPADDKCGTTRTAPRSSARRTTSWRSGEVRS